MKIISTDIFWEDLNDYTKKQLQEKGFSYINKNKPIGSVSLKYDEYKDKKGQ